MRSAILCLSIIAPAAALASPWVLPRGTVVVEGRYDYAVADEEFLDEGSSQAFPLAGRYAASTYTLDVRLGFSDRLEFEIALPIRQVTYTSDPVILLPNPGTEAQAFDFYQENVINLSRSVIGVGDIDLAARYQISPGPIAFATEVRLKTPSGYSPPAGTFGDRPTSRAEFEAQIGELVNPENVEDDVTLGDGQVDLTGSLLLGVGFRTGTFVRLDAGYRARFGGAGHQVVSAFRVGQLVWERVLFLAGVDVQYTVTRGDVIGISVAADDPSLPAAEYIGTDNLVLREVRLERDLYMLPMGVIIRAADNIELNATYMRTLWGRNTAAIQSLAIGVGVRVDAL